MEPLVAVGLVGQVGQRASATFSPLLGLVGVIGPTRAVDVAAVAAAGALAGQPLVAFGPPDDRPGAGGWLAGGLSLYSSTTTLAPKMAYSSSRRTHLSAIIENHWYSSAADRSRARVEGYKHRIQTRHGRLAASLASAGDGPLADRLRVSRWHAEAMAGEGLAQRRPGDPELGGGGGVDAAEPLGEPEGALGFGPVGEEAAGLPAHRRPLAVRLSTEQAGWVVYPSLHSRRPC